MKESLFSNTFGWFFSSHPKALSLWRKNFVRNVSSNKRGINEYRATLLGSGRVLNTRLTFRWRRQDRKKKHDVSHYKNRGALHYATWNILKSEKQALRLRLPEGLNTHLNIWGVTLTVLPGADDGTESSSWMIKFSSLKIQKLGGKWFLLQKEWIF